MSEATQISAQQVNDLRAITSAGLMDCKRALVEAQGNVEAAIDLLRKKGLATAAKRADRTANEGVIAAFVAADNHSGALTQVSCETDFVAKTDDFKNFAKSLAQHACQNNPADAAAMETQQFSNGGTVKDLLTATIARLGENMALKRTQTFQGGFVEAYIHLGGKVGVLVQLNTASNKPEIKTLAKDIAMHIAASSPSVISREQMPADAVAKEKEIAVGQAAGKPAQAVEKIVAGKLEKFYAQSCLLEQPFVKNPDQTISALVGAVSKTVGEEISVKSFVRFQVGA